jgi:hypothetical protein
MVILASTTAALAGGCTQNDDPEGARDLFAKINEGAGFRSWRRAPNFPSRQPSFTAHADAVEIFVNPKLAEALDGPMPVRRWPVGSIVVKEGFGSGDERQLVAVMEKRTEGEAGWYWAEYGGDGDVKYSGQPTVCIDCHDNRKGYSDWIYAFEFPR